MRSIRHRRFRKGMTLIELMIVVVIIGVLSIIAVTGYRKYTFQARSNEAKNFLGAIRVAQEAYFQSFGEYCGDLQAQSWPAQVPLRKIEWGDPEPPAWQALGIKSPGWVSFQYDIRAGFAENAAGPAFIDQPQRPWFVATAKADFLRGDNGKETFHEITSESEAIFSRDENH